MQLRDMRTLRELRSAAPDGEAVRRLSDRALRAALHNPDHSAAARAAAEAELRARNARAERWRIVAPGFLRAAHLEGRSDTIFFGWQARLRGGAGALGALLGAAWLAQIFVVAPAFIPVGWTLLAALVAAGAWSLLTALRLPARIAVISASIDPALRKMLARELKPYGHVFALGEGEPALVRDARDYRQLARRLTNRVGLNFRAALSPIPVRATHAWRPVVAHLLMDSSDAIVVDVSNGDDLLLIQREYPIERCVFVALWGKLAAAEAMLQANGIAAPCFHFAPDGEIQHRGAFRAAILDAMRATHKVAP